ncbi:hypothetical protein DFAR_3280011 [Desulfarculales bacterium]
MVPVSLLLVLVTALCLPRLLPPAWRLAGLLFSQDEANGIRPWMRRAKSCQHKFRDWPAWPGLGPASGRRRLFRSDSQDLAPPF